MHLKTAAAIILIWLSTIMILELNAPHIMLSTGIAMLTAYHVACLTYMRDLDDAHDKAEKEADQMRRVIRLKQGNILESSSNSSIQACAARSCKYLVLVPNKDGTGSTVYPIPKKTGPVTMTVRGPPAIQIVTGDTAN